VILGVLGVLGVTSLTVNGFSIATGSFGWMQIGGLTYGGLAIWSAILLRAGSQRATAVFWCWGALVLLNGLAMWPDIEPKRSLVVGLVGFLLVLIFAGRRISSYCGQEDRVAEGNRE